MDIDKGSIQIIGFDADAHKKLCGGRDRAERHLRKRAQIAGSEGV